METYMFVKEGSEWYIDLPEYLEQGGAKRDLQMVEGADTMLDVMAERGSTVVLNMAEEPFEGADELVLVEKCDPSMGGGYYLMEKYNGKAVNQRMWLCQVTEFVFGKLPERFFVKQEEEDASA